MPEKIKILIPAFQEYPAIVEDVLAAVSHKVSENPWLANRIHLALSEAFNNAFLYSSKDTDSEIKLEFEISNEWFKAVIVNQGKGITKQQLINNSLPSDDAEGGRGINIIKNVCDSVEIKRIGNDQFCLHLEFDLKKQLTNHSQ